MKFRDFVTLETTLATTEGDLEIYFRAGCPRLDWKVAPGQLIGGVINSESDIHSSHHLLCHPNYAKATCVFCQ